VGMVVPRHGHRGHGGGGVTRTRTRRWMWMDPPLARSVDVDGSPSRSLLDVRIDGIGRREEEERRGRGRREGGCDWQ
jgi:hypothetical protein